MGKNSKARREARRRKQDRSGHGRPSVEEIDHLITNGVAEAAGQVRGQAHRVLLTEVEAAHPRAVDQGLYRVLGQRLHRAWKVGWQPVDLAELAKRRCDESAVAYLVDAVAAEHEQYAAATIDPRWQEQLDGLAADSWWEPDRSHLTQWAERRGEDRTAALDAALAVVGLVAAVPEFPRLMPIPGEIATPTRRTARAASGIDQKILGRIRGLLAKAEATSFTEEADALSAKAQELMAKYSLDRALIDASAESAEVSDGTTGRRMWLEAPYVSAKANLVHAVAQANGCRAISYDQIGFVTVLGHETNVTLVELLVTSLLVQASREMLRAGSQTGAYGQSRTRSYRQSFLVSYAVRIGERLQATAREAQEAYADPGRLLPVLASREQQVDRLFTKLFPNTVSKRVSVSNAAGWAHGRTAADLAHLDTRRPVRG